MTVIGAGESGASLRLLCYLEEVAPVACRTVFTVHLAGRVCVLSLAGVTRTDPCPADCVSARRAAAPARCSAVCVCV